MASPRHRSARTSWARGLTHKGLVRARNEDALCVESLLRFAVLGDGVGGNPDGDAASRAACEGASAGWRGAREAALEEAMRAALDEAQRAVRALKAPGERKPASTIVALGQRGDAVALGHVGDSRCYRLREDALEQLTVDHTMLERRLREGALLDEFETQRTASWLTQALGEHLEEPVVAVVPWTPGDRFLLCSDGLSRVVAEDRLRELLRRFPSGVDALCDALVEESLREGAPDNVTVIVVEPEGA